MADKINILIIEGTTRPGRRSINVAKLIDEVGQSIVDVKTTLIDPTQLNFPLDGSGEEQKDPKYTKATKEADAFIIVVPEYNHGYPGTLKRMLDSELKNYINKPALMAGVSIGPWGGTRAIENLTPVLRELGMVISSADLLFPSVGELFDESGKLKDEKSKERIAKGYAELIWLAKTMKHGRDNISKSD